MPTPWAYPTIKSAGTKCWRTSRNWRWRPICPSARIEDATGRTDDPIYDLTEAVDRVKAAVEAVRSLPYRFTLTARAENQLHGRSDLKDTIRRLQACQEAGADVLYAPGLRTWEDIARLLKT